MTATTSPFTLELNNGTLTTWLPLTTFTPNAVASVCSSAVYFVPGANLSNQASFQEGGFLVRAFDPWYYQYVEQNIDCLAPQQTSWWDWPGGPNSSTILNLGPFACPTFYTTAATSSINAQTTEVACCPSEYVFQSWVVPALPYQCYSPLTSGQVIAAPTGWIASWTTTTVTVTTTGLSMQAGHVNGFIIAQETSAPGTTSAHDTAPAISSSSPTISAVQTSTSPPASNGLNTGAKVGIGVAIPLVALAIIGFLLGIFLMRRRSARAAKGNHGMSEMPAESDMPGDSKMPGEFKAPGMATNFSELSPSTGPFFEMAGEAPHRVLPKPWIPIDPPVEPGEPGELVANEENHKFIMNNQEPNI